MSYGVLVVDCAPESKEYKNMKCDFVVSRDASKAPLFVGGKKKQKKEKTTGNDDTASMIKGGGYLGARTRQTIKKKLMWGRGVVCRSTRTQSLTVVACVILQCIP
jgi:hypothetical protein